MPAGVARRVGAIAALLMMLASATGANHAQPALAAPRGASIELGKARLALIRIPGGTFRMGTDEVIHAVDHWKECPSCPSRNDSERPAHRVTIRRDFWMGQYPVTQGQWKAVMGRNPAQHQAAGPDAPIEQVNWNDVQAFLAAVNAAQSRWTVRLPTEAE